MQAQVCCRGFLVPCPQVPTCCLAAQCRASAMPSMEQLQLARKQQMLHRKLHPACLLTAPLLLPPQVQQVQRVQRVQHHRQRLELERERLVVPAPLLQAVLSHLVATRRRPQTPQRRRWRTPSLPLAACTQVPSCLRLHSWRQRRQPRGARSCTS